MGVPIGLCTFYLNKEKPKTYLALGSWIPPPRLERGLLPPEGSALSTELWGRGLDTARNFTTGEDEMQCGWKRPRAVPKMRRFGRLSSCWCCGGN
jgi:hypothetical protein